MLLDIDRLVLRSIRTLDIFRYCVDYLHIFITSFFFLHKHKLFNLRQLTTYSISPTLSDTSLLYCENMHYNTHKSYLELPLGISISMALGLCIHMQMYILYI